MRLNKIFLLFILCYGVTGLAQTSITCPAGSTPVSSFNFVLNNGTIMQYICVDMSLGNLTVRMTNSGVINSGVFTNTQQNDYLTSVIGNINLGTRYSAQQGGNFATEAIAGGVNCSGTVHQCNGVAGYVQSTSTTPFPVALYGQAEVGIANGKAYGENAVVSDTASLQGTIVGGEDDINVNNAASTVVGRSIQGAWTAQPLSANAYNLGTPSGGFHWQNGFVVGGGFTNNACAGGGTCGIFVINQESTGAGKDSQQILFNSSSKSSLLRLQESDGFLFHNNGYTAPVFASSGANHASSGTLRLVSTEAIVWRNNANSGDVFMGKNTSDQLTFGGLVVPNILTGNSGSIGGGALAAGGCTSGNVTVTGARSTMRVLQPNPAANPIVDAAHGLSIWAWVSANDTVQVVVCAIIATTPNATTYQVGVIP